MNVLPSIYRESVNFVEQSFLPTLTAQQQKVVAIALFAFSCLVACYALYDCVRNWKVKEAAGDKIEETEDSLEVKEKLKVRYEQGVNVFSFEVLQKKINASANDNCLISPLGISLLLSMIKHGVGPKEQEEIDRIIHLPENSDEMKVGALELIKNLKAMGFDFASLVYLNPTFRLNPNYQKLVAQYFQSKVEEGNSADQVNKWVVKSTNGQIKEIITQEDLADFVVVLANALHFKAKWRVPFKAEDTYKQGFATSTKEVQVDMMHNTSEIQYFEDEYCQALKLVYSDAKDVSLVLILPKKDNDFSFVNAAAFGKISQGFTSQMVKMSVPKFKIEHEVDVKAMCEEMGIQEIFNKPDVSKLMDFKHREPEGAYFSQIKQKSALACDEEGTEASSVTVAIMTTKCCHLPPAFDKKITFDRPFLAALVTKDAPVLFGVIRDPLAG